MDHLGQLVKPDTKNKGNFVVRKNITVGYNPPGSHTRLRWIAVAVGLTVTIGLLAGSFALGRATTSEANSPANAPAEPLMHQGVPVPDRHTPAGAATAAANFQIAGFRVSAGTLDAKAVSDVLLAPDVERGARTVLSAPTADPAQLRQVRTSFAPLSTVVVDYHPVRATVQVWGVSATSSQLTPQPNGTETWGRSTISMTWDGSQWRVRNQEYSRGPWPVRSDERLADADGEFGFRFSELLQHGWSYVPEQ